MKQENEKYCQDCGVRQQNIVTKTEEQKQSENKWINLSGRIYKP